jgi:ribosomal protein L13E
MTSLTYLELKEVIAVKCVAQFKLQTAGIDTFCARKHGCPVNSVRKNCWVSAHYLCFKMTSLTYSELKKVIAVRCITQFKLQTAGIDTFCARKHGCPVNSVRKNCWVSAHYLCFKMTSLTYSELEEVIAVKCVAQFKLQTAGIDTFCARKHGCPVNSGARKHGCPVNSVNSIQVKLWIVNFRQFFTFICKKLTLNIPVPF